MPLPKRVAALIDEGPVQPGVESVGIVERGQLDPSRDERFLRRFVGVRLAPEDCPSRPQQP